MTQNPSKEDERENQSENSAANRIQLPDGQGGILSNSDRCFLLRDDPAFPDLEWEGNETQKRWRIREKVKTALSDFQLLNELNKKEQKLIFDNILGDGYLPEHLERLAQPSNQELASPNTQISYYDPTALGEQYYHLQEVIMFVYTACELFPGPSFERLLEDSLQRYILQSSSKYDAQISDVDVDVKIEEEVQMDNSPDIDEIEAKLKSGEPLTREEVGELFIQGRIEPGDFAEADFDV